MTSANGNNNFGEPLQYDKNFKGPQKDRRSCTDVICLIIFVVFLAVWIVVGYFAIKEGDLNRLLVPTDSNGRRCGVDSEVHDKKFLFFFNLEKCISPLVPINGCPTPQVCVEECPQTLFVFAESSCDNSNFETNKNKLICNRMVDKSTIKICNDIERLITEENCARWYLPSQSFSGRCIPFKVSQSDLDMLNGYINESDLELAIGNVKVLSTINGEGQKIVQDIIETKWQIPVAFLLAMVTCLILIALMRWIAGIVLWTSIFGVIVMLGVAIYICAMKYKDLAAHPVVAPPSTNLNALLQSYLAEKNTWMVFLVLAAIVLIIILLLVLFLRKRIVIAIALVKEGSKAVASTMSTVFFPIFPWILQIGVIGFAIIVGLYLASVGEQKHTVVGLANDTNCHCTGPASTYKDGDFCVPEIFSKNCHSTSSLLRQFLRQNNENPCTKAACHFFAIESSNLVIYSHIVNVIGFLWVIFFISAFGEMVLASTFATWYWSFKKSDVPFFTLTLGIWQTLRYHIGTLAFGSLIITICRIIRLILEYIDQKLKKYDNACTRAMLCCMKCFFWCLENFLKFLNKNAYIMCAIHGKNFCSSAKDAFNLLMRNFLRVIALDKVTDFLFFLSKVLVTLAAGAATYFYCDAYMLNQLNYIAVPVVIVMIGTYLISTIFFGVYTMAVNTLFLCFLEDSERNDGSPEKPYFMSKNLMKILGKKNKTELSNN